MSLDRIDTALTTAMNLVDDEILKNRELSFAEQALSNVVTEDMLKKITETGTTHNRVVFYGNKKQGKTNSYAYPALGEAIETLVKSQNLISRIAFSINKTFLFPIKQTLVTNEMDYESFMLDFYEHAITGLQSIITNENTFYQDVKQKIERLTEMVKSEEKISRKDSVFAELIAWLVSLSLLQEKSNLLLIESQISNDESNVYITIPNNVLRSTSNIGETNIVGRVSDINEIHKLLDRTNVVFISSMGGCGKTQVVRKYIAEYGDKYDTIVFAKYEKSLTELVANDGVFHIEGVSQIPNESDEDYAKRKWFKISQISDSILIVIDNYDTISDKWLFNGFLDTPCKFLFTTRKNFDEIIRSKPYKQYNLEPLAVDEQVQLFELNYKRTIPAESRNELNDVLEYISGHTLTIILIARMMKRKLISFKSMLDTLQSTGVSPDLNGEVCLDSEESATVYQHIHTLMRIDNLSEPETHVLQNLSLLPLSGVPLMDFNDWLGCKYADTIFELIDRNWIEYDIKTDTVKLHPIISDIMRNGMTNPFEQCKDMLDILSIKFARSWEEMNAEQRYQYGEYAKSLYYKLPKDADDHYLLYRHIGLIVKNLWYYNLYIEILKCIHSSLSDTDSMELAWYYFDMAEYYKGMLQLNEAEKCQVKAIEMMRTLYPNSYDLAFLTKSIIWIIHENFRINGDITLLQKARDYLIVSDLALENSLKSEETRLGSYIISARYNHDTSNQAQKASYLCCWAENSLYSEDYERAIQFANESFQLFNSIFGYDSPDTHAPLKVLANTYSKIGDLIKSTSIIRDVLQSREKVWGVHSKYYWTYVETYADILYENGKWTESLEQLLLIQEYMQGVEDSHPKYARIIQAKIEKVKEKVFDPE